MPSNKLKPQWRWLLFRISFEKIFVVPQINFVLHYEIGLIAYIFYPNPNSFLDFFSSFNPLNGNFSQCKWVCAHCGKWKHFESRFKWHMEMFSTFSLQSSGRMCVWMPGNME